MVLCLHNGFMHYTFGNEAFEAYAYESGFHWSYCGVHYRFTHYNIDYDDIFYSRNGAQMKTFINLIEYCFMHLMLFLMGLPEVFNEKYNSR